MWHHEANLRGTDSSYVGEVTLKVTYQCPLALRNYLGHLVGHEGAGSLQSFLKRRGVGVGEGCAVAEKAMLSIWRGLLASQKVKKPKATRVFKLGEIS